MENERAAFIEEVRGRMDTMTRLSAEIPQPPNPRPQDSDAVLKRRISRLKKGLTRNPGSAALIDTLQREREYRRRVRALLQEAGALEEILSSSIESVSNELLEQIMTVFHDAKHLPAASDPNSDISEFIRTVDRARRADSGRPRRK